jgi:hypothetical protein
MEVPVKSEISEPDHITPEIPTSKADAFLSNSEPSSNSGSREVAEKPEQLNHIEGLKDIAHKTTASAISTTLKSLLHQFQ